MSFSTIPQRDSMGHSIGYVSPFASKEVDGKKLYKRVHGVVVDCSITGGQLVSLVGAVGLAGVV